MSDDERTVRSHDLRNLTLDIYVRDLARAQRFYEQVLGWQFEPPRKGMLFFQYLPGLPGRVIEDPAKAGQSDSRTVVDVRDARAAAARARELGAELEGETSHKGRVEVLFTDPEGARFSVVSPA